MEPPGNRASGGPRSRRATSVLSPPESGVPGPGLQSIKCELPGRKASASHQEIRMPGAPAPDTGMRPPLLGGEFDSDRLRGALRYFQNS